ncbi:MAG: hypothetical protein KDE19_06285 [Caldilineaceae bacterium]|nr:hypothetical protein [Caldilineaceae bacterium]
MIPTISSIAVGIAATLLILKKSSRFLLYCTNVNTRLIIPMQIVFFVVIFTLTTIIPLEIILDPFGSPDIVQELGTWLGHETPVEALNTYYASLAQGLNNGDFWAAYDLQSRQERSEQSYDQFRLAYAGLQRIQLQDLQITAQNGDQVTALALVRWFSAEKGMLFENKEWVYHQLTREGGQWRIGPTDSPGL